jgi:hypothetical protein
MESLQDGNLFMNNLEYYINLERKTGIRGKGDKYEAARVFTEISMKMVDQKTGELFLEGQSSGMYFRMAGDEKRPVYCLFTLDGDIMEVIDEDKEHYIAKVSLPAEPVEKMVREFGNDLLFINPVVFLNRVRKTFNRLGYAYNAANVVYDDYNVNTPQRMESFMTQGNDIYFWKDKYFENQKEFRIVLTELEIEEPLMVNIGDIRDISKPFKADEFFGGRFAMYLRK